MSSDGNGNWYAPYASTRPARVVLGVSDAITAGAALLVDGRLVAAVNEERLVRKKMVIGFPWESIRKVFEIAGIAASDVDQVAVASVNGHLPRGYVPNEGWFQTPRGLLKETLFRVGSSLAPYRDRFPILERGFYALRWPAFESRRTRIRKILAARFDIAAPVRFVDHHYCHATSAHFSSGYERALVVTMDGGGDARSSSVFLAEGGRLKRLCDVSSFDSLGNYYAYITHLCGFKAAKHEGKITGLAAHGRPLYLPILEQMIRFRSGRLENSGGVFYLSALRELSRRLPEKFDRADLAASIQIHTERLVEQFVGHWQKLTGLSHVALAGGLFANVRVNQKVHELPGVSSIFVHPGMSDEGLAVGAALALRYQDPAVAAAYDGTPCLEHVYLGPEFSESEIRRQVEASGLEAVREENVEQVIAGLLSQGYVVARFAGRMEYGPRALGNRSILFRPDDPSVNDWLNQRLRRTEFMPFAPSTLAEHADLCFNGVRGAENAARFMTITFDCTPWMRERCAGVVHLDGTARPQLVSARDNPSYYRIIDSYYRRTGVPTIVNTSFNIHEEPIVCSPADAIRAFRQGHLDYLALDHWLLRGPNVQPHERGSQAAAQRSEVQPL